MGKSVRWTMWSAVFDLWMCLECKKMHGTIYGAGAAPRPRPPAHENCRCEVVPLDTIMAGKATDKGVNGADFWLMMFGRLPDYYMTFEKAKDLGWRPKKDILQKILPGVVITKGQFHNKEGKLPAAPGRTWTEADIKYEEEGRGLNRILFSNDGLIFVTFDHYTTFKEIVRGIL